MPRLVTRRPHLHHHSSGEKSDGLKTLLAVVAAQVFQIDGRSGEYERRVGEVYPSLVDGRLALRGIVGDLHMIKCTPNK